MHRHSHTLVDPFLCRVEQATQIEEVLPGGEAAKRARVGCAPIAAKGGTAKPDRRIQAKCLNVFHQTFSYPHENFPFMGGLVNI